MAFVRKAGFGIVLAAATVQPAQAFTLSTGSGEGDFTVGVDLYGAFGSSVNGADTTDALFNPVGDLPESGTVFESAVGVSFANIRAFLNSGEMFTGGVAISDPTLVAAESVAGQRAVSTFTIPNLAVKLTQEVGPSVDGGVRVEAVTIDQTPVGDGDFFIVSLPAGITWDTRDDPLNATRGFVVAARTEPLYEVSFGNVGVVGTLRASTYYSVIEDRLVLAGRAEFGSIVGMPLNETPASRLFFAGGGGAIRGYDYRSVGPVDRNGCTIGGRSLCTTSAEARVNVTRRIQVVPFVDAGNAFEDEFPDFSEPLRYAAGIGVRYITGLGPIRLDVATPLNPRGGDPEFAVYLGLGQAF